MLEIENISKTFYKASVNEVKALNSVLLSIAEGSFVIVIGTNGSGKSTLLNAVAGVFPLDQGKIILNGTNISDWPEFQRANLIGRVFQNPFSGTAANMTVAENLALASKKGIFPGFSWLHSKQNRRELQESVASLGMGLESRLDDPIGSLSGGQRQALTLLMATFVKPALLLLDEHTAALDPKSSDQIIRITKGIVEKQKITTLMVTHSMTQAAALGDRLIMMHRGEAVMDAQGEEKKRISPEELYTKFEELRRSDLLDEQTAEMLRSQYI
ncbi:MAG: ATP-binding cassette domain-containing protein [Candidatus Ozemobacteraceae bacterium]